MPPLWSLHELTARRSGPGAGRFLDKPGLIPEKADRRRPIETVPALILVLVLVLNLILIRILIRIPIRICICISICILILFLIPTLSLTLILTFILILILILIFTLILDHRTILLFLTESHLMLFNLGQNF